eukprot:14960938-Alexandrium_andersonii.AAC.1
MPFTLFARGLTEGGLAASLPVRPAASEQHDRHPATACKPHCAPCHCARTLPFDTLPEHALP